MSTLLVLDKLVTGGTERQMEMLGQNWPGAAGRLVVLAFGGDAAEIERWEKWADLRLVPRRGRSAWTLAGVLREVAEAEQAQSILAAHRYSGLLSKMARLRGMHARVFCCIRGSQPWNLRRRVLYEWVDPLLMVLADGILLNSRSVGREVKRLPWLRSKIRYVPNGLEAARTEEFRHRAEIRASLGLPQDALVLLSVGRLEPVKDPGCFLRVSAALVARGQRLVAVWVGEGSLRGAMQGETERLGLAETIRWVGAVPDPADWFAASDVYFHPSTWENTSNAILEAMRASCPVVARRVGGNAELVEDDQSGFLFDAEEEAVARAAQLLEQPEAREAFGEAGRERAVRGHSVEQMVQRHVEILVLEGHRR